MMDILLEVFRAKTSGAAVERHLEAGQGSVMHVSPHVPCMEPPEFWRTAVESTEMRKKSQQKDLNDLH